jgi:ParB family protein of integrating conjugative element (PFGI_1 class)
MKARPKRPSHDQLQGLLLEGHFASGNSEDALPTADPVTTVAMVLSLAEIKPYDRNPRREMNPCYEEIKASILEQRGLNNPFNITRRPDESHYMVQSGGNTRLAILNELYQQTGDEAFNTVHCLFIPWQSESAVLCAHLIENELRGEMTLIDKAYAIRELKQQLETEANTTFSRSEFCKRAKAQGFTISRRHLIRFDYALTLDQLIPSTLRQGLGANRIDSIKAMENAYHELCADKTDQFAPLFAHVMASQDEQWDLAVVRRELDRQLASILAMTPQQLRQAIDARLFNKAVISEDNSLAGNETDQPPSPVEPVKPSDPTENTAQQAQTVQNQPMQAQPTENPNVEQQTTKHPEQDKAAITPDDFINPQLNAVNPLRDTEDLKSLYSRTFILAQRIAKTIAMEQLVLPVKQGLGFVIEKPEAAFTSHESWGVWWLLLGISEQSVSEDRLPLWQHTALYQLYNAQETEQLTQLVGPAPTLPLYPYEILHDTERISDRVFRDIFRLMETCRTIRHTFSSTTLWPTKST